MSFKRLARISFFVTLASLAPYSAGESGDASSESLTQALESIRAAHKVPAMAAFVLQGDHILEQATVGTRSAKDNTPIGPGARWHLGSNTKAMTATLAGILVEEGLLRWDMALGDALGDAAPDMDPGHRDTTLSMLLSHTGGLAANIDWFGAPEDRVACVTAILSDPPAHTRGEYLYSNVGYTVAGAMMETITGESWEVLLQTRLFEKLNMTHAGFGAPKDAESAWGHNSGWIRWIPVSPEKKGSDNAPVLGPAGTVHADLGSYARFVAAHLAGARGEDNVVSAKTYKILHTPPAGRTYALGWGTAERAWADGKTLSHNGSNTMWFATVWLAPQKNMAFFAVSNAGGKTGSEGVNAAIEAMIGRHLEL
jgi:CubicO group peptidase (beta-lactamase class C family)